MTFDNSCQCQDALLMAACPWRNLVFLDCCSTVDDQMFHPCVYSGLTILRQPLPQRKCRRPRPLKSGGTGTWQNKKRKCRWRKHESRLSLSAVLNSALSPQFQQARWRCRQYKGDQIRGRARLANIFFIKSPAGSRSPEFKSLS